MGSGQQHYNSPQAAVWLFPDAFDIFLDLFEHRPMKNLTVDPFLTTLVGDSNLINSSMPQQIEIRNRYRDAQFSDENAIRSVNIWPPDSRPLKLQIIFVSKDKWSKSRDAILRLLERLPAKFQITVMSGRHDEAPFPDDERIELLVYPGKNVFELRSLIPLTLQETAWFTLIEDHSIPDEDWLTNVENVIDQKGIDCLCFTSSATNNNSLEPWSWANFIFNFIYHWHPSKHDHLTGTVATSFFRRDLLGRKPLQFYFFENSLIGRIMPVENAIKMDHVQHRTFFGAMYHNFNNGQAAGAAMRLSSLEPVADCARHLKELMVSRCFKVGAYLAQHPMRTALPHGTSIRVSFVAIAHCVGYVIGVIIGPCGAYGKLE